MDCYDLTDMHIKDKVAVYTPLVLQPVGHSLSSDRDQVEPLNDVKAGDVMKFAMSGGVTIKDETTSMSKSTIIHYQ